MFQIRLWAIDALIKRASVYEADRANWSIGYQVIQDTDMYEFEQNLNERDQEMEHINDKNKAYEQVFDQRLNLIHCVKF